MNNRLVLSPPPAKNILLSSGEDVESAINRLNNRTSINCIGYHQAPEKDRTANRGGLYSYVTYQNSDMPCYYGVTIGWGAGTAGSAEITIDFCGAGIWYRYLRDWQDSWSSWHAISHN